MRSKVLIHSDVVNAMMAEPHGVKLAFYRLVVSLETGWPKLNQLLHGDRRIKYNLVRRKQDGIALDYITDWLSGSPLYTITGVTYLTTRAVVGRVQEEDRRVSQR